MRSFCLFALCIFTVTVTSCIGVALAQEKPKVIVTPFKNSSKFDLQTTDSITDTFISILMDTNKFTVLERERVKDITEEKLQAGNLSIEGADFAFLNNISTLDLKTQVTKIPIIGGTKETAIVKVQINVRVVDISTSRVMFSAMGKAEGERKSVKGLAGFTEKNDPMDNSLTNDVMVQALKDVVGQIVDNLFPIKVIAAKGGKIYINRGKPSGINIGQVFAVYSKGEELVDPDTGLVLGAEEERIGVIRIIDALPKYSIAEVTDGAITNENKGAECRVPVIKAESKKSDKDEESQKKSSKKFKKPW
jgi:curli biogenesis system outer membrane secretion channel CsgG